MKIFQNVDEDGWKPQMHHYMLSILTSDIITCQLNVTNLDFESFVELMLFLWIECVDDEYRRNDFNLRPGKML